MTASPRSAFAIARMSLLVRASSAGAAVGLFDFPVCPRAERTTSRPSVVSVARLIFASPLRLRVSLPSFRSLLAEHHGYEWAPHQPLSFGSNSLGPTLGQSPLPASSRRRSQPCSLQLFSCEPTLAP